MPLLPCVRCSGLLVYGIICGSINVGRFPMLMYQHRGFSGVDGDVGGDEMVARGVPAKVLIDVYGPTE